MPPAVRQELLLDIYRAAAFSGREHVVDHHRADEVPSGHEPRLNVLLGGPFRLDAVVCLEGRLTLFFYFGGAAGGCHFSPEWQ